MSDDTSTVLSRRQVIGGGAAALALAAGGASAQAATYSRVAIDVATLQQRGLGPYAELVRAALGRGMQQWFGGRIGGAGPALVIRVTDITLSGFAGPDGGDRGGARFDGGGAGQSTDYMDGEALIVTGGAVSRRYPQLITLPSSYAGSWYLPNFEQRRTAALCDAYANWLSRAL